MKESQVLISVRVEVELMHGPRVHRCNEVREVRVQHVVQRVPLTEVRFLNPRVLHETRTVIRARVHANRQFIHLIGVQIKNFDYRPAILVTR